MDIWIEKYLAPWRRGDAVLSKFIQMSKRLLIVSVSDKVLTKLISSVLVFPALPEAFPQPKGKSKVTSHSLVT